MSDLYNPLHKINLGKSVAEALLGRDAHPLGSVEQFDGAGIYAIYYRGDFAPYAAMAERNTDSIRWPIYIGKAVPSGARLFVEIMGRHLWSRLRDHADSIRASENLDIGHFSCRYLCVDDIWIPLGETLLIAHFKPVWNMALEGFGNHDPGAGRYNGLRPLWDVLHPGRHWAERCRARPETSEQLAEVVAQFSRAHQPEPEGHIKFTPG